MIPHESLPETALPLLAVAAMLTLGAVMQAAAPSGLPLNLPGVPLEPRTVYLTFDDGPSRNTEAILSVLREEEVPATFFVTAGGTGGLFRCLCRPL